MDSTSKSIIRISLDLETASLETNAAIVQIGACVIGKGIGNFMHDPEQPDPYQFNSHIDLASCERVGLHVDKGTMEWWNQQDPELRAKVFSGKTPLFDALIKFSGWCYGFCGADWTRLRIYCKGPEFDWIILREAYYATLGTFPFHYRSPQSIRTIEDLAEEVGISFEGIKNTAKHDALADAVYQAKLVEHFLES